MSNVYDFEHYKKLKEDGWRILTIWECAIKGKTRLSLDEVIGRTESWLVDGKRDKVIKGKNQER